MTTTDQLLTDTINLILLSSTVLIFSVGFIAGIFLARLLDY